MERKVNVRKVVALLLCLLVATATVGCKKNTDKSEQSVSATTNKKIEKETDSKDNSFLELKVVRIAAPGSNGNLIENGQAAQKLGFIDEELKKVGYTVEYQGFAQAGPAINEAYGAKEIDLAVYGDLPHLVAASNDIDIKVFASVNSTSHFGVLVQNDSTIHSSADLEGKKVIVGKGTTTHKYFEDLLIENKLDESKLNVINALADAQTIFASKEADALPSALYILYYYESLGLGKVIETSEGHEDWTCQYFFSGRTKYLSDNPEVPKAIIRALIRSQEYVQENPDQYGELLAQKDGITAEAYQKANSFDNSYSYLYPELTESSISKINSLIKFAYENGLISNFIKAEDVVDTSYFESVKAESSN